MKELSLNILDIAKNSVTAGASLITITVAETVQRLTITVSDNGCGMTPEFVARVTDPFTTTRTTRKVGLGIPLLQMEAQMAGGDLTITSEVGKGTTTTAWFDPNNIDMPPLGDLVSSVVTLIQGSPEIDFLFTHSLGDQSYDLDTREIREIMGGISLAEPEILAWLTDFLTENESTLIEGKR
jgi:signal transduction histidine kinase